MDDPQVDAVEDVQDEMASLVAELHAIQLRLQVLAGGQLDSVLHPGGHSYLLHEAQEKLWRSEMVQREFAATQSSILNALPAHIALLNQDGLILSVNDGWRDFAGHNPLESVSAYVGQNYPQICEQTHGLSAADAQAAAAGIQAILSGASPGFVLDYPCHSTAGQQWSRLRVSPMQKAGLRGAVVMHVDITASKLVEEAAQRSQKRLRDLIDGLGPSMFVAMLTPDGILVEINRAPLLAAGLEPEDVLGKPFAETHWWAHSPEAQEQLRAAIVRAAHGEASRYDVRTQGVRGEVIDFDFSLQPLRDENGNVIFLIPSASVITERRESEERLRFLNELADATRTQVESNQIMAVVVQMLGKHLGASRCVYAQAEKDGVHYALLHEYLTAGCESLSQHVYLSCPGSRVPATLFSGQTLVVRHADAELSPEEGASGLHAIGVAAMICCPLVKDGENRFMVALHQSTPRNWTPAEIALVQEVVERSSAMMGQRTAEENLRQREALLRIASRAAHMGGWAVDLPPVHVDWSDEVCAIHDMPPGSKIGIEQAISFYVPRSRETVERAFVACVQDGTPFDFELEIITARGRHLWVRSIGEAQRNVNGVLVRVHGAFQDITERKQAELEVSFNEQRYRSLVETTTAIVWDTPASGGQFETEQPSWTDFTGQTFDELRGWGWLSAVYPEDQGETARAWTVAVANRSTYEVEHRLKARDQTYRNMMVRAVPIVAADGAILQWIGVHTDITARKMSEQRIAEQAALIDQAQDAILLRGLDNRVTFWSKGAERLFGWTAAEAIGRPVSDLVQPDPKIVKEGFETTFREGKWSGEMEKVTKTGEVLTLESRWTLVRGSSGEAQAIMSIDTDITDRKKIEQQFLRAQRMESIGTLAGGIAHDLNNTLSPIILSLELLAAKFTDPDSEELLEVISARARRGSDMVRQVLTFARGVEGERQEVQLRHLIREVEKIVNDTFFKHIDVHTYVPNDLWAVLGDATQLHQVLLNLCVNARDAMPRGGKLVVSAENLSLDEHYSALNTDARPGPYVLVQVEDSGTGIPPEIIEKIFDPFFTTKEAGKGTGLGLSTSLGIVKSHGGFVRVYSEAGKGAKFEIYLPAQIESASPSSDRRVAELPRGHGELILVVDDEEAVRHVTNRTLEAFGYRVLLASDGAAALATYATRATEIAVVFTDMMMPVMDGPAIIEVLRRINPDVRIIGASGLSIHGHAAHAASLGVRHFLPKPYTAESLLKALRQIIEEKP